MAGLASTALVLSIAVPFGGAKWYLLTALSPLAGVYYWQRGTRQEEIQARPAACSRCHLQLPSFFHKRPACMEQVKMVTSDDETVTDITVRVFRGTAGVHVTGCRGCELLQARRCWAPMRNWSACGGSWT